MTLNTGISNFGANKPIQGQALMHYIVILQSASSICSARTVFFKSWDNMQDNCFMLTSV